MQCEGRDATLGGFDIGKDEVVGRRKVDGHISVFNEFIVHHHPLGQTMFGDKLCIRFPSAIAFSGHDQRVLLRQPGKRFEKHVQAFVGTNQPKKQVDMRSVVQTKLSSRLFLAHRTGVMVVQRVKQGVRMPR
ncbi:MAG: hypothetical protein CBC05_01380 [Crocinitomicaceae bacterium TMED45]|nr:MAG: hypothetical protein CBC05_01380 [Crocinitomicaceae bacterium TMED45]